MAGDANILEDLRDIEDHEWLPLEGASFIHLGCGGEATKHPDDNRVWKCNKCPIITSSVGVFFVPAVENDKCERIEGIKHKNCGGDALRHPEPQFSNVIKCSKCGFYSGREREFFS